MVVPVQLDSSIGRRGGSKGISMPTFSGMLICIANSLDS